MESCTGGLLAATITDIPGASTYFKGGLVAYSSEAKIAYGIDARLINEYGVISAEIAQAMAQAARLHLEANIGIGITGVAGPNEMEGKPAGTVYIGIDDSKRKRVINGNYPGDRARVKCRATTAALFELSKILSVLD
jgi:nicotinamide-nucleotide amidase